MRRFALAGSFATAALLSACSYLAFLKPPTVPRERGEFRVERGSAYSTRSAARADEADGDWLTYNRSFSGERYAPLSEIDRGNVAKLGETCRFRTGERTPMQSGPLEVGGTIYLTSAEYTYAVDAASCALRWKARYKYRPAPPFNLEVNRGVAYLDGRLFRGANDGRVYALDAATGRELWNVRAGDPERGETFPAAPVAWRGRVFIGNAGGDNLGVTGRMMAFDAATGGRLWTFEIVPRSGHAATTWPAETEVVPRAGGATWTSYTIDTTAGLLYVPTGNAAPDFAASLRPGRNLHTVSVIALDLETGVLRAAYQLLERDWHDWDVAAAPALIRTRAGVPLVVEAGKDGHVYGIESDGKFRYRTPVTTLHNVDAPLTAEGTRFCPGVNGGVEWNGPTYSRAANMLYVGAIDWCTTVKLANPDSLRGRDGMPWTGSSGRFQPFGVPDSARRGWLTALDAEWGEVRWRRAWPTPLVAGVTSTQGGVVFTGDLEGNVLAFDDRDGSLLWKDATGLPIGGGVITYLVGRKQYLAVAAGLHAPLTWRIESPPAALVIYTLMPPSRPGDVSLRFGVSP
jgi:alcohol dehydrogenase (cytochrome c)